MTFEEHKAILKRFKKEAAAEEFNTNNAWGFGGGVGTEYTLLDFCARVGVAYYRHLPPVRFFKYFLADEEISERDFVSKLKEVLK